MVNYSTITQRGASDDTNYSTGYEHSPGEYHAECSIKEKAMAATSVKAIIPGVMLRKGAKETTIRFLAMIKGQRFQEKFDIPCAPGVDRNKAVALYVDPKTGKATRLLKDEYRKWYLKKSETVVPDGGSLGPREPSVKELLSEYEKIALARNRNPSFMRPSKRTIDTAIKNFRYVCKEVGVSENDPIGKVMNTDVLEMAFNGFCERVAKLSAWSYIESIQTVTAKWTLIHYQKIGWKVVQPIMPDVGNAKKAPSYKRPSKETIAKIEKWYATLANCSDNNLHLAVLLIYELAVRPVDVPQLTGKNFRYDPEDGMTHIVYTPQKTKYSSGREVNYPIAPAAWQVIERLAGEKMKTGEPIVKGSAWLFHKANTSMRIACDLIGTRDAIYQLRKLCIDTKMRQKGMDHAVALSGDRRDTAEKFYSEPTRVIDAEPMTVAPIKN